MSAEASLPAPAVPTTHGVIDIFSRAFPRLKQHVDAAHLDEEN